MENDLFQQVDGGATPTSPLQKNIKVKWQYPYYDNLFHIEFDEKIKKLKSAKQLVIKKIEHSTANEFVKHHHYLRRKIYIARNVSYGVYFSNYLVGVCMFGMPVWTTYPDVVPPYLQFEVPELNRLSLLNCCPKNSASRVISICLKLLKKDWKIETGYDPKLIFSMSDDALGFKGHIYKASGFIFLKTTSGRSSNAGGAHGKWAKNNDKQYAKKSVWIKKY